MWWRKEILPNFFIYFFNWGLVFRMWASYHFVPGTFLFRLRYKEVWKSSCWCSLVCDVQLLIEDVIKLKFVEQCWTRLHWTRGVIFIKQQLVAGWHQWLFTHTGCLKCLMCLVQCNVEQTWCNAEEERQLEHWAGLWSICNLWIWKLVKRYWLFISYRYEGAQQSQPLVSITKALTMFLLLQILCGYSSGQNCCEQGRLQGSSSQTQSQAGGQGQVWGEVSLPDFLLI